MRLRAEARISSGVFEKLLTQEPPGDQIHTGIRAENPLGDANPTLLGPQRKLNGHFLTNWSGFDPDIAGVFSLL
jgi:hypothetical protein